MKMSNAPKNPSALADVRVGDVLPRRLIASGRARQIDAVALIVPGRVDLSAYARRLEAHADDFAAWDGRITWLEPAGDRKHRVVIADRYGQVYDVTAAADAADLPSSKELEAWFKFLATACPECGVIDDPLPRGWTP